jgi:hypothetical protein
MVWKVADFEFFVVFIFTIGFLNFWDYGFFANFFSWKFGLMKVF